MQAQTASKPKLFKATEVQRDRLQEIITDPYWGNPNVDIEDAVALLEAFVNEDYKQQEAMTDKIRDNIILNEIYDYCWTVLEKWD